MEDFLEMKTINYHEMGSRIRKQRELLGYTREQLAEKLDVSTKFCSDIELGVKDVSIQTLAKLTELLHLSADYILFGECIQGNSMELEMLFLLNQKCPEKHRNNLINVSSMKKIEKTAEICYNENNHKLKATERRFFLWNK